MSTCSQSYGILMQVIGQFHLSDYVNRFRRGSLVMRLPDSLVANIPTILFGTINGAIGVVASLPAEQYNLLISLQEAMKKVIKGVGGFDHGEWRAFATPFLKATADSHGFIDGDLVELFLDLKKETMNEVLSLMPAGTDSDVLYRLIEDLSRLH